MRLRQTPTVHSNAKPTFQKYCVHRHPKRRKFGAQAEPNSIYGLIKIYSEQNLWSFLEQEMWKQAERQGAEKGEKKHDENHFCCRWSHVNRCYAYGPRSFCSRQHVDSYTKGNCWCIIVWVRSMENPYIASKSPTESLTHSQSTYISCRNVEPNFIGKLIEREAS